MKKPAKLNYMHLCDYAMIDPKNKVSAIGIFDYISFKSLPAIYPIFYLAVSVELLKKDRKNHDLEIRIVDSKKKKIAGAKSNLKHEPSVTYVVTNFPGVTFNSVGKHKAEVYVDGELAGSTTLDVRSN